MANLITIVRSFLVFFIIFLLFVGRESTIVYLIAFVLTIIAIVMDGLDGYIARKYNETSKLGAVLDIIGDRIVENIYWVAFTALGWINVIVPIIVLTRGIVVDGIRSVALERGMTAFGKTTMMKSKWGKFLVASKFSRGLYAAFKGIAFSVLILAHVPNWEPNILKTIVIYFAYISAYITVFLCVIRGLPVIIEGKTLLEEEDDTATKAEATGEVQQESSNPVRQEFGSSH